MAVTARRRCVPVARANGLATQASPLLNPWQVTSNLTFFVDSVAAAGTALLLGMAAMSPQQDPAAASAPFDSGANG